MSNPRPSSARCPFAPLPATSSISRDIGLFSLIIEPDTCTLAAPLAAAFAATRISSGDFDASPLDEEEVEEPPQPANTAPAASASEQTVEMNRRFLIWARTLAVAPRAISE